MSQQMARRQFLQTAAVGAMSAGLGVPASAAAQDNPQSADAAERKTPRLYPGCCAYSYGPVMETSGQFGPAKKSGQMTMESFIRKAVELRLSGVDMTVYYYKSTDPAYLASLRHLAYKHALPFSGAACGVSMVQADPDKRAQALTDIKKWVDVADHLGAPHLRVFAGNLPAGVSLRQAIDWSVDTLKAASEYSEKKGIVIGVEDHAGVTQGAEVCLEIMHRVDSPYAGINLDITHFRPTPQQDAYAQIASCIPYATNTHIRDHFDDGTPVDMDRVWRMFADTGFKGYMSAEYEAKYAGGEDPMAGVPKLVAKIRALCEKYSSV